MKPFVQPCSISHCLQYFPLTCRLSSHKCASFVSISPRTQGGEGCWLATNPHYFGCGALARLWSWVPWNKTCALHRPGEGGLRSARVCVCVCARPRQREEPLRKLGRLAVLVSVLILAHICHWSSSAHMFPEREAPKQLRTLTRLKLCVFTVVHCYLQCECYFLWRAMYGTVQ